MLDLGIWTCKLLPKCEVASLGLGANMKASTDKNVNSVSLYPGLMERMD